MMGKKRKRKWIETSRHMFLNNKLVLITASKLTFIHFHTQKWTWNRNRHTIRATIRHCCIDAYGQLSVWCHSRWNRFGLVLQCCTIHSSMCINIIINSNSAVLFGFNWIDFIVLLFGRYSHNERFEWCVSAIGGTKMAFYEQKPK